MHRRRVAGQEEEEEGEGKVTRLELFMAGVVELTPQIRELIRAA